MEDIRKTLTAEMKEVKKKKKKKKQAEMQNVQSEIQNRVNVMTTRMEEAEKMNKWYTRKKGAWVARLVKRPTSAHVMISWFMSLSPISGSVLTAWSLKRASDSVSPSLCAPPLVILIHSFIHSLSLKNIFKK